MLKFEKKRWKTWNNTFENTEDAQKQVGRNMVRCDVICTVRTKKWCGIVFMLCLNSSLLKAVSSDQLNLLWKILSCPKVFLIDLVCCSFSYEDYIKCSEYVPICTGCPKKHRNSVTNWISYLLWISVVIPNFKSHNIIAC